MILAPLDRLVTAVMGFPRVGTAPDPSPTERLAIRGPSPPSPLPGPASLHSVDPNPASGVTLSPHGLGGASDACLLRVD